MYPFKTHISRAHGTSPPTQGGALDANTRRSAGRRQAWPPSLVADNLALLSHAPHLHSILFHTHCAWGHVMTLSDLRQPRVDCLPPRNVLSTTNKEVRLAFLFFFPIKELLQLWRISFTIPHITHVMPNREKSNSNKTLVFV